MDIKGEDKPGRSVGQCALKIRTQVNREVKWSHCSNEDAAGCQLPWAWVVPGSKSHSLPIKGLTLPFHAFDTD